MRDTNIRFLNSFGQTLDERKIVEGFESLTGKSYYTLTMKRAALGELAKGDVFVYDWCLENPRKVIAMGEESVLSEGAWGHEVDVIAHILKAMPET